MNRLAPEQQMAGAASVGLGVTLVLPWYEKSFVPAGASEFVSETLSGFGAFSWVEAAVLLVALSVLALLWARAHGRPFHLPFGDGTVIAAAGTWVALLLVWRLFDRPDFAREGVGAATVGLEWGIFVAFAAAGLLAAAGARLRSAGVPEPPLPGEDYGWVEPRRTRRETAAAARHTAVTEPLARRRSRASTRTDVLGGPPPAWEGDVPPPPGEEARRAADPPRPPGPRPPAREAADPPAPDRLF